MSKRFAVLAVVLMLLSLCSGAFGATYYMATNGSDGNPGSISQPWATLSYAVQHVAAGDTINVRAGTYNQTLYWASGTNGAPGQYITIQAYDGDRTAIFQSSDGNTGVLTLEGRQYVKFIGLQINGGYYNAAFRAGSHHIELKRAYCHDSITGDVLKTNQADYITFEGCEICYPGGQNPTGNNQGIDNVDVDYAIYRNNYFHHLADVAFYAKGGAEYVIAEGNVIYGVGSNPSFPGPAIYLGGETDQMYMDGATFQSYYMVVRNNIVTDFKGGGVASNDTYHGYFYNNAVINSGSPADNYSLVWQRATGDAWTPATEGIYIFNNIFLDTRGQMPNVYRDHSGTWSDWQHDYNNYYNNGSAIPTGGMFNPNLEAHSTFGNPSLTMSGGTPTTWQGWVNYYRPAWNSQSNAMLKDKGLTASTYPPGVLTDIEGVSRPRDGGWDIGPYEYPGTVPAPTAAFSGTPTAGAVPLAVTFTDSSIGTPTAWSWTFGDSGTSTAQNPSHTYNSIGSFTVTLTVTNASGSDGETKTSYITGKAVAADFTFTPSWGVPSLAVTFSDTTVGSPTSWSWTFGDGGTSTAQNPSHTYTTAGYRTVALTATKASGSDTMTKTNCITVCNGSVTVYPTSYTTGCGSFTGNLSDLQTDNGVGLTLTPDATHALMLHFFSSTGYTRNQIFAITASTRARNLGPSATSPHQTSFFNDYIAGGCPGDSSPYNLHVCGWCPFPTSFITDATTLSGTADLAKIVNDSGQVGLAWRSGDPSTKDGLGWQILLDSMWWKVYLKPSGTPAPVANFTGNPTTGTAPLSVSFTDTSSNTPTAWSWTFGDSGTSTAQNPAHSYASAGTYTVALTATNAGGNNTNTKNNYITVTNPAPVANFSANVTAGVAPLAVNFTDTSTNTPTSWSWTFGDSGTSTVRNPSHTYNSAGYFTVTLTATNAAGSDGETKTNYITSCTETFIYPSSWETPTNPVTLLSGTLTDLQTDNSTYMVFRCNQTTYNYFVRYKWTPAYTPAQINKMTVEYQWKNTSATQPTFCNSIKKSDGSFYETAWRLWTTTDQEWDYPIADPATYFNNNEIWVDLCGCDQMSNTISYDTSVDMCRIRLWLLPSAPVANFSGTPTIGAPTLAVTFTDSSTNTPTAWSWTFGDSNTSTVQNPSHSYTAVGNYTVALTATNASGNNTNTKNNYITVGNKPGANFSGTPTIGAPTLAVTFTDSSTYTPTAWSWTFGDSSTSTVQNPSHTYASTGNYTVALTATNAYGNNTNTKNSYISVTSIPAPVANFSGTPTVGAYPLAVTFTDSSTNTPTAWSWTFGDSSTSTAQNPSHTYNAAGNYSVALTATNAGGNNTMTKTNYIMACTEVTLFANTLSQFTWVGQGFTGTLADVRTDNGIYHVTNSSATTQQDGRRYMYTSSYAPANIARLYVENQWKGTRTDTPGYVISCKPDGTAIELIASHFLPTTDTWDTWYTDTPTSYIRSDNSVWIDSCGCPTSGNTNAYTTSVDVARLRMWIKPGTTISAPTANFTGTPTTGSAPLAVTFTDSSTGTPTFWAWDFGDGTSSTVQSPSHTYSSNGTYSVTLMVNNGYGSNTLTRSNYITVSSASAPTFVASGAVSSGTGTITPALPGSLATNDILLLFLETANQAISITNQNGGTWTQVTNSPQSVGAAGGSNGTRLTVFWSRYNGTQGAPTASDSGDHQLGRIIAIRGATTSGDPCNITAGGTESTVDTSGAIAGATTTVANTLVVAAIATSLPDATGTANFSAWTNANLTSLTERTDDTVTAGNGGGLGVATGVKATAGAYTTTAVTCETATTKAMMSLAIRP